MKTKRGYTQIFKECVLKAYRERMSLRGIERVFGICRQTTLNWLEEHVATLPSLGDTLLAAEDEDVLELDEVWSFVASKSQKRWVWTVMCRRTRQIIAFAIGDRSEKILPVLLEGPALRRFEYRGLAGDLVGSLEIGIQRCLLDVGTLGGACRVDIYRQQSLGVIDDDSATRWQGNFTLEGGFDLSFDLVAREQRHRVVVAFQLFKIVRHDLGHELLRTLMNFFVINQDFAEFNYDALTGKPHPLPFLARSTYPVDLSGDGYHELVSVVTTVTLVDELTVSGRSAPGIELLCDETGLDTGEANMIVRAARALARRAGAPARRREAALLSRRHARGNEPR